MEESKDNLVPLLSEKEMKLVLEVEKELNEINDELNNLKLPEFDTLGVPSFAIEQMKEETTVLLNTIIPTELQTPELIEKIKTDIVDFITNGIIEINSSIKPNMTEKEMLEYSIKEVELDNLTIEKLKDLVVSLNNDTDPTTIKYLNDMNTTINLNKKQIEDMKTIVSSL